ncbi:hypothetical protein Leryth_002214 [Lithospermum erythrorhizon]|nr:hypothetical protein Leryth_002214 [Lithospermum erythrorhizon]
MLLWDTRSNKSLGSLNKSNLEVESISITGFNLMVAAGSSVHIYDLRQFSGSVQSRESNRNFRIKCVRPICGAEGFVVGSVDGRVALEYFNQSNLNSDGYTFRCHPRRIDKKYHHAAVNDIVFNPYIHGTFVTGDNDGYVSIWDALSKKRLHEQTYPNSVVSLSYNHDGLLLAVASGCTYQEANEREEPIQIFVHEIDNNLLRSISASKRKKQVLTE